MVTECLIDRAAWKWTARKGRAATMIASGRFKLVEVAREVATRIINKWQLRPEFQARVDENVRQFTRRLEAYSSRSCPADRG